MTDWNFPPGFIWGTATASYQIEGAVREDGRGASIWDAFSHTPGKTLNGDTGDVACDHYHRWPEDIAIMQVLNLTGYRFSIAWPRILPQGRGAVNHKGLDFYSRLVDGLLDAGITPFVTLYHWDLPQALQDEGGGWARRGIVDDFVNYADIVSRALGDRVKYWTTFNEIFVFCTFGYLTGEMAPGMSILDFDTYLAAIHHALLAHGRAVPVLRANVPGANVGIVHYTQAVEAASRTPEDIAAARRYDGFVNRWYFDPIYKGEYPADMAEGLYAYFRPPVQPGDMEAICAPLDFQGVNFYERSIVGEGDDLPLINIRYVRPEGDYTAMGWQVYPPGLYAALTRIHREYAPTALYVTENGAAFVDDITPDGGVHDDRRIAYLRGYFVQAARAIADGVPLKGYFVWSLLDNFEWAHGYDKRFGVVYVDYPTQRRIIKDSGRFLAQVAARMAR